MENLCTACDFDLSEVPDDWTYTCAYCEEDFCRHCQQTQGKMAWKIDPETYDECDDEWMCADCVDNYEKPLE